MNDELFTNYFYYITSMNSNIGKLKYANENKQRYIKKLKNTLISLKINGITDWNRNEYVNVKKQIYDNDIEIKECENKIKEMKEDLASVHLKIDKILKEELDYFTYIK